MVEITAKRIEKIPEFPYPCLVEDGNGLIVFATCSSSQKNFFEGVIMTRGDNPIRPIGYFSDTWDKQSFRVYSGIVTIQNKEE